MKRNITIAAITAAVLIGGTGAATVAFADDDNDGRSGTSSRQQPAGTDRSDDRDDDRSDDRSDVAENTRITLDQAVAAALKSAPGTVTEAGLDDDDDDAKARTVWELDVYGSDKAWHDVTVDATSGKVLRTRDDGNDDRDRNAPRSSTVTLDQAAQAALKSAPGTVTSIDLDDDDDESGSKGSVLRWGVDIAGKDGKQHELNVDAKTGKVTVDQHDDDRDDGADDRDDRDDDRDGDDG
ncbi:MULTISPECIES: PepSY domain-containing protein [unclassified Streptomyces]|uniref:PepSY domain-containing protein n=1 Tax=unclassified Streptomyces TaxID=2593676 RepID=UPI00344DE5DB